LLLLQAFSTSLYRKLVAVSHSLDLISINIFPRNIKSSILTAAALAVKETYFYLFLCFDFVWLAKPYIHPTPASNFVDYLDRLRIGIISGEAFLIFTIFFWLVYITLYLIGISCISKKDIQPKTLLENTNLDNSLTCDSPRRVNLSIEIRTFDENLIQLNAIRMRNKDKQPLILWPGFFQNGHVYDLQPGETSLAEYLWEKGFDIWIIHSRGTGGSNAKCVSSNLDDLASSDIPQVIEFVLQNTGKNPIYIGHSQGGITAIMSLMGAEKETGGKVILNDNSAIKRQSALKALITFGSFPDFVFSKPAMVQDLVENGFQIKIFNKKIKLISADLLLRLLRIFKYLPLPILGSLRIAILNKKYLKILFWPLYIFLVSVARLRIWEFLYHFPNVDQAAQDFLFCKTIDGTYHGILTQFQQAVKNGEMESLDKNVNYSENYHRLTLPVSFVAMEYDSLADPVKMNNLMFEKVSSEQKFFTEWKGQGHEDFFMNSIFFQNVFETIQKIN
jgi:pimeloyl-ACP methyl ester carboxylesterase